MKKISTIELRHFFNRGSSEELRSIVKTCVEEYLFPKDGSTMPGAIKTPPYMVIKFLDDLGLLIEDKIEDKIENKIENNE